MPGAGHDSPPPRPGRGYGGRRQLRRFRAPPPLAAEIVSRFEFGARRLVGVTCRPGPMRCSRGRGGPGQSAAAAGDTDVLVARERLGPLGRGWLCAGPGPASGWEPCRVHRPLGGQPWHRSPASGGPSRRATEFHRLTGVTAVSGQGGSQDSPRRLRVW